MTVTRVAPIASDKIDAPAPKIINELSAALTPEGLVELNARSIYDQSPAAAIAEEWLAENN